MTIILLPNHQDPRPRPPAVYSHFRFDAAEFPELPRVSLSIVSSPDPVAIRARSYTQVLMCPNSCEEVVEGKTLLSVDERLANDTEASDTSEEDGSSTTQEVEDFESSATPEAERPDVAVALPSFDRFLELPIEIREVIWEFAMRGTFNPITRSKYNNRGYLITPIEIRDYKGLPNDAARPFFLPSVCRVSRLTMSETIGVFVRGSEFLIASFIDNRFLDRFLQTMSKGYEAIRSVHFAFFDCFPSGFPQNSDLELVVRCTGLRTIKITFHATRLITWVLEGDYDDGLTSYPRPVDEMWSHYKFDRLLDCMNLQNIIIQRKGRTIDAALKASENLGERIKAEYTQKHQRSLNVTYTYF
jgi:hypothetical protein